MSGIQGKPTSVRLEQHTNNTKDLRDLNFVTVQPSASNRYVLDVMSMGTYLHASAQVVEAGSNNNLVVLTGHGLKKGDIVRLVTTANSIQESEIAIDKIVDVDSFELASVLSASLTAGDTFDVLRPITQRFSSDGSQIVSMGVLTYNLDGNVEEVTEDTGNAANNRPLPVKIVDIGGDININADQINVQLSHTGATPDSVQIGNGTNIMAIDGSGAISSSDSTTHTKLDTVNTNLGTINTSIGSTNTALGTLNGKDFATSAKQDAEIALLTTIDADTGSIDTKLTSTNALLTTIDTDTGNIDTKLATTNSTLGTIDTDTGNIATSTSNIDTNIAANLKLKDDAYAPLTDKLSLGGTVRQDTLASEVSTDGDIQNLKSNAKGELYTKDLDLYNRIPAQGQAAMAGSLPVVIASNQTAIPVSNGGKSVVTTVRHDYSGVNVTTGAWVQLVALTGSTINEFEIFDSSGQTLEIGTGGVASESRLILVFPGGNGRVPVNIAASTRISIRAVSANATVGEICINFFS